MTTFRCAREKDVAELLHRGHWPQACPAELRAHVDKCSCCAELILVTQTFQQARAAAVVMPRLDAPGVVWWRAQLRRRNAAIERIGRPLLGAQLFALAMSLIVAAGMLAWQTRRGFHITSWLINVPGALHFNALLPSSLPKFEGGIWIVFPILATIALLSGVVVYLGSERR